MDGKCRPFLFANFTDKQLGMMGIDFIKKKYLRYLETSIETILNESYEIELVLSDDISEEESAACFYCRFGDSLIAFP